MPQEFKCTHCSLVFESNDHPDRCPLCKNSDSGIVAHKKRDTSWDSCNECGNDTSTHNRCTCSADEHAASLKYKLLLKEKECTELRSDIAHAYKEAKEYCPDYPWSKDRETASDAVWAVGQSYRGVSSACDDWRKLFAHLAPEVYAKLPAMTEEDLLGYEALMVKIQKAKP